MKRANEQERGCKWCGKPLNHPPVGRGRWPRFCSAECRAKKAKASFATIRQLRPGEPVPTAKPRRYVSSHGYVRLRWRVGTNQQVETYEHRVVDGRVTEAQEVHHLNGHKADNRPENLVYMTAEEHADLHRDHPRPRRKPIRKPQPFRPKHDLDAVRALATEGLSQAAIAKRIGCGQATVSRYLSRSEKREPTR